MTIWLTSIFGAYLLGSIPFGYLIGRAKGIDVRSRGSGNIGATNVGRLLGRRYGFICFFLDAAKGAVPVIVSGVLSGVWGRRLGGHGGEAIPPGEVWLWLAVAMAALLGHMYSPWLGFKGGKGVATGFGGMVAMWPLLTVPCLAALLVWVLVLAMTRFVALASMAAAISLPFGIALFAQPWRGPLPAGEQLRAQLPLLVTTTALALFVIFKHRANIARLRFGTEPKIGSALRANGTP